MEIETAARRMLLAAPAAAGYVQDRVYKFSLLEPVEGTGGRAIVVRRSNGWSQPDAVQSSEYPVLALDFWADNDRDADGLSVAANAIDKAYAVYRAVDPLFHRVRDAWWGAGGSNRGLRVISSTRFAEPSHRSAVDRHAGGANETDIGDSAVVTVTYALHLVH